MKLNRAMQNHLNKIELNTSQLTHLKHMQKKASVANNQRDILRKKNIFSLVASIAIIATITLYFMQKPMSQSHWIEQIANEVAKNHLAPKPLEVVSTELRDVQGYFTKLDFLPISSSAFNQLKSKILTGGRYCSIEGSRAAQLRYTEDNNNHTTLYQTNYKEVFSDKLKLDDKSTPITTYARGVKITIWQEKGLLMVTAKSEKSVR